MILSVPEQRLGADRNGDLDENDTILQIHDLARGTTLDTGLAVSHFAVEEPWPKDLVLEDRLLVARIEEFLTGEDGNGDGDLSDQAVFAVRIP